MLLNYGNKIKTTKLEYENDSAFLDYETNDVLGNLNCKTSLKFTKGNRKLSSSSNSLRKTSIARIGSVFRDLQQTINRKKTRDNKTSDHSYPEFGKHGHSVRQKSTVCRSVSLPNMKTDKENRRNIKKNVIRKLSNQKRNQSTPVLDFESSKIISFPSNRLESYRTKSYEQILSD